MYKLVKQRLTQASLLIACGTLSANVGMALTPFMITPRVNAPTQLYANQTGVAIYQVTNNTTKNLILMISSLPQGATLVTSNIGPSYCTVTKNPGDSYYHFPLNGNTNCLIKVEINAASGVVQGGPNICVNPDHPINCSSPVSGSLNVQILPSSVPSDCNSNTANFNYELTQNFDNVSEAIDPAWGPYPIAIPLSPSNPNIESCYNTAGASWKQQRVLNAADFWINQKLNYCHHYLPDWMNVNPSATKNNGGYCATNVDIMPGSAYYNQAIRWNYSGTGSETAYNWLNNDYMWYGMDCSNYTRFIYSFALDSSHTGIYFSGNTQAQAGQCEDASATVCNLTTSPNQQGTEGNLYDVANLTAGKLVCGDGTYDTGNDCVGHGLDSNNPYYSAIDYQGHRTTELETEVQNNLGNLQPGDMLYIAADLSSAAATDSVTHVVIWTGKKAGIDIPLNQIAPDELCPSDWQPTTGEWVITDSHYQGADYRVITPCFYLKNLWAVRRVITS